MSELVAWLRARLAEDEAAARAAADGYPAPWEFLTAKAGPDWVRAADGSAVTPPDPDGDGNWEVDADVGRHIARWDPARVLAEVEAKRGLLDRRDAAWAHADAELERVKTAPVPSDAACTALVARGKAVALDEAVLALAQPYADRPGFDPAWRLT